MKSAWSRVPIGEKPKVLSEIFATIFPSDTVQASVGDDASVIVHLVKMEHPDSAPITMDTFKDIQSMYKGL